MCIRNAELLPAVIRFFYQQVSVCPASTEPKVACCIYRQAADAAGTRVICWRGYCKLCDQVAISCCIQYQQTIVERADVKRTGCIRRQWQKVSNRIEVSLCTEVEIVPFFLFKNKVAVTVTRGRPVGSHCARSGPKAVVYKQHIASRYSSGRIGRKVA